MQHCPAKAKSYKKKSGKCGCCCTPRVIKRLPYVTISNKTAASETGAPILIAPVGTPVVLWSAGFQPASTCLNGPLSAWFNATNGQFTILETGLYSFTFTGNSVNFPGVVGYHVARLGYSLVDVNTRCINSTLPPTANNTFTASLPTAASIGVTVSATLALVAGDVITFVFEPLHSLVSTPVPFIFEIDVVQHSRLDKAKVESAVFA